MCGRINSDFAETTIHSLGKIHRIKLMDKFNNIILKDFVNKSPIKLWSLKGNCVAKDEC